MTTTRGPLSGREVMLRIERAAARLTKAEKEQPKPKKEGKDGDHVQGR